MQVSRSAGPVVLVVLCTTGLAAAPALAQDEPTPDVATEEVSAGLPIFATLGFAFGQRKDGCVLCESPEDDESFAAHVSVGKYLGYGVGVGVDASLWRRSRPSGLTSGGSEDAETATSLTNTLGNASLVFSLQRWNLFVRAGGGLAWGAQDSTSDLGDEEATIIPMSGMGVGYTFGAGLTLPLHPMVSLAFFGNYNVGMYDLTSPQGSVYRDATHEVVELGVGITLR